LEIRRFLVTKHEQRTLIKKEIVQGRLIKTTKFYSISVIRATNLVMWECLEVPDGQNSIQTRPIGMMGKKRLIQLREHV